MAPHLASLAQQYGHFNMAKTNSAIIAIRLKVVAIIIVLMLLIICVVVLVACSMRVVLSNIAFSKLVFIVGV